MSDTRRMEAYAETPLTRAIPAPVLLAGFASTLFLSALLLFAVQPMFAKMVLPILGGSPAVWSVAMCFFQAALLGGHAGKLKTAYKSSAVMVAFARTRSRLEPLRTMEGWEPLEDRGWRIWTDDYSNVLRAILASNSLEKSTAKRPSNQ